MHPLISICIPTYNRADLLDYCLDGLAPLRDCGTPVEIVVSDNGSTDHTPDVVAAHRDRNPAIRPHRLPENRGPAANWYNALRKANGEFMLYLADDDSLIVDNLLQHIETLKREPDLVAIYADWIAWDDQAEREIHRHFGLSEFMSFGPEAPLDLVNFILKKPLPPEISVYRRDALLRAHSFHAWSLPFHLTMYRLSRLGRIGFDPLPFYREHRILKDRFHRTHWANMAQHLHMLGEELRLSYEEMVLMAMQDAGASSLTEEQATMVRRSIDRILHSRIALEVDRACARKDWIMAVELRRRHVLWHGPGTEDDTRQDVLKIVIPAALQAVQQTFNSLSDTAGLCLRGFESGRIAEFFTKYYPDTPLLAPESKPNGGPAPLIVHRDAQTLAQDAAACDPGQAIVLEHMLDLYRVTPAKIDLKGF
jgi:glycosyltransferase involved in cell wall biosynthesis